MFTVKLIKINGSEAGIVDKKIYEFSISVLGKISASVKKRLREMETADAIKIKGLENF